MARGGSRPGAGRPKKTPPAAPAADAQAPETLNAAKYSAPTVDAEYLSALWNADIESVRRAKSGAVASDVYNNKIVSERSYMQDASTRVVTFEMCGNDGLQARSAFKSQTGTCDYSGINTAVANCKTYVAKAMDYINANAYAGVKLKVISNIYYPGYNGDNVQSSCKDATTGATINVRDKFLLAMATINYWMCEYARQKGFKCTDNFAEFMGADYDSNGDGKIDMKDIQGAVDKLDTLGKLGSVLGSGTAAKSVKKKK